MRLDSIFYCGTDAAAELMFSFTAVFSNTAD